LSAGIIATVMVLLHAMAYNSLAGLPVKQGLYFTVYTMNEQFFSSGS
jgi:hypothetical protein